MVNYPFSILSFLIKELIWNIAQKPGKSKGHVRAYGHCFGPFFCVHGEHHILLECKMSPIGAHICTLDRQQVVLFGGCGSFWR